MSRALATLGLLCIATSAYADRKEWTLGIAASGAMDEVDYAGGTASPYTAGGRLRLGYGIGDAFELGVALGFSFATAIEVPDARFQNRPADLWLDFYALDSALELRFVGGVDVSRAFARFHPIAAARAGLLWRWLDTAEFRDAGQGLLGRSDGAFDVLPAVGGSGGVEGRFGSLALRLLVDATAAEDFRSLGLSLEARFLRY